MSKPILYDLGVAVGAMSLWVAPFDIARLLGYSASIVFAGHAYYQGVTLLSKERKDDEKQGITYEAELDFYEQLLANHIDSVLEVKSVELETKALERLIPLVKYKQQLEEQIPVSELTDEQKELAAKSAIKNAFVVEVDITDELIREHFPEGLDNTTWKAILKALQDGISRDEIVKSLLDCNQSKEAIGKAYFELLKRKFLP